MRHRFKNYKVILAENLRTFSLLRPARPDFMKEDVELVVLKLISTDNSVEPTYSLQPIFTNIPAEMARKYHWVMSYEEYRLLAAIIFCWRFPEHTYTKEHHELVKAYSKEDMFTFVRGINGLSIHQPGQLLFIRLKWLLKLAGNLLAILFIVLIIPVGVYIVLRDKLNVNQKDAIIYSIVFYACWLLFAKFSPYLEMSLSEIFKKKNNKSK